MAKGPASREAVMTAVEDAIRQECAVLAEDLRKTKAERDRLLEFVIQKCDKCGIVTAPDGWVRVWETATELRFEKKGRT